MRDCHIVSEIIRSSNLLFCVYPRSNLLHPDAVARTIRERIEAIPAVIGESWGLSIPQPAFGNEFLRGVEITFTEVHRPMGNSQDSLTIIRPAL